MNILAVMENVQDLKAYSGGRYHAWLVCKGLAGIGHDVAVMTGRVPVYVDDLPGGKVEIFYRKPYLTQSNCELRAGERHDFDLVVVFPLRAIPWGVKLAQAMKTPCFVWVFDPFILISMYAPAVCERMGFDPKYHDALCASDRVVASTEVSRQHILAFIGEDRDVKTLYPCVNSLAANSAMPLPRDGDGKKVIAITRATTHKRPDHIYKAVRGLLRDHVAVKLHVLSGFAAGHISRGVKRYGIEHVTEIEAKCSEARKWELFRSADLLVGASTYEGFGFWLMEAIYACVPFVVYDFPIFKEISRGDGGWFATYNHPQSFAANVAKALAADARPKVRHLSAIAPLFSFEAFKNRLTELVSDV